MLTISPGGVFPPRPASTTARKLSLLLTCVFLKKSYHSVFLTFISLLLPGMVLS